MKVRRLSPDDGPARKRFTSGVAVLDTFLQRYAGQNQGTVGSTYVAIAETGDPLPAGEILGFVTVAAMSLDLPDELRGRLPRRYPLPALLLARLARSTAAAGHGVGAQLVADVFRRAVDMSDLAGCVGVVTDPKDDGAVAFYERLGFASLALPPRPGCALSPMFVAVGTIRAALG